MIRAEPLGWPDLHGFRGDCGRRVDELNEHEEHGYKHTHALRLSSLAGNTNPMEFVGRDPKGRIPNKEIDEFEWNLKQQKINPRDRIAKQKIKR